jgi:hypothetical protein
MGKGSGENPGCCPGAVSTTARRFKALERRKKLCASRLSPTAGIAVRLRDIRAGFTGTRKGMAMNKQLDLFFRLKRTLLELDDQNDPFTDHVRKLMDPL